MPKPKGKSVKIKTVPGHKMVAVRFRGPAVREVTHKMMLSRSVGTVRVDGYILPAVRFC